VERDVAPGSRFFAYVELLSGSSANQCLLLEVERTLTPAVGQSPDMGEVAFSLDNERLLSLCLKPP